MSSAEGRFERLGSEGEGEKSLGLEEERHVIQSSTIFANRQMKCQFCSRTAFKLTEKALFEDVTSGLAQTAASAGLLYL